MQREITTNRPANAIRLLERVARNVDDEGICRAIELRRNAGAFADVTIRCAADAGSLTFQQLFDEFAATEELHSVRKKGNRITFRFTDGYVNELGRQLEVGEPKGMDCRNLLQGKTYVVDFYGANTTKALHMGHMRNLALGHALASAMRGCGANVTTQSMGSDIGRQVCEAMAGYTTFYPGQDPEQDGVKADHFVGCGYSRYVQRTAADKESTEDADAPIAREMLVIDDLAQTFLQQIMSGDDEVRALWRKICDWAIVGQAQTLAQLGVTVDRLLYESEFLSLGEEIVRQGLQSGIFARGPDGSVVYRTGLNEYSAMLLVRRDGFPTAHLRDFLCLGIYLRKNLSHIDRYVQFCADEWSNAVAVYREILARLSPEPFNDIHQMVFHGLVTFGGDKLASSGVDQQLIDDVFQSLAASEPVRRMAVRCNEYPSSRELARIILLVHFLSKPPALSIEFSQSQFFHRTTGHGWTLAQVWARVNRSAVEGSCDSRDPDYRFAVIQSQRFPRVLSQSVDACDPSIVVKYLHGLARWYLDARVNQHVDRVMRTILAEGFNSLGIQTSG